MCQTTSLDFSVNFSEKLSIIVWQIFCRRDQKEKLSEIKLPLKIEDCWYEFAIKKSPDELHTLVGDPELMGEYEDVSDTGIIF